MGTRIGFVLDLVRVRPLRPGWRLVSIAGPDAAGYRLPFGNALGRRRFGSRANQRGILQRRPSSGLRIAKILRWIRLPS